MKTQSSLISVVAQAEIEKEKKGRVVAPSQRSPRPQTFSSAGLDQSRFIGPELPGRPGGRTEVSLEDLSLEELVARAEQRQLAEQQDQLRSIIDFQRRREAA